MFSVRISYESGAADLFECTEDEAREHVSQATLGMASGEVIDVVAWES